VRFKLDENIPASAKRLLVAEGHDVHSTADEGLNGSADPALLQACISEGRILVTLDVDFADIRLYPPSASCGIWVLRPDMQTITAVHAALRGALRLIATETPTGRLWIVEEQRVRIRG
jgi:predicted nuclease of predicted toxin-antitoxin system